MSAGNPTPLWGEQVRTLLGSATNESLVVAPFIKEQAFKYLLEVLDPECNLTCVTRWLPADVASGVSDTEILDLVEARERSELRLLDDLHAKLFLGDSVCLVGSANVTLKGLGLRPNSNTELLVEVSATDAAVEAFRELVMTRSRPATVEDAQQVNQLAERLRAGKQALAERDVLWVPTSLRPGGAFECYTKIRKKGGHLPRVEEDSLLDIARSGIPPGLRKEEFDAQVESRLLELPALKRFVTEGGSEKLRRTDFEDILQAVVDNGLCGDIAVAWRALSEWIGEFVQDLIDQPEGENVLIRGKKA